MDSLFLAECPTRLNTDLPLSYIVKTNEVF